LPRKGQARPVYLKAVLVPLCLTAASVALAQPMPIYTPPGTPPAGRFEATTTVGPPTHFTPSASAAPTGPMAPVPVPKPAPFRAGAQPAAAGAARPATASATPARPTSGKTNTTAAGKPRVATPSNAPFIPPQAMNAQQRETLMRISAYFNSLRTLKGDFIQIGPRGEQSEGQFFLSRPGKIRFHYRPPVRVDVISDGRSVAVEDRTAMTQNIYPLSRTPLKYLLAERVDLASGRIVAGYRDDQDVVSLLLAEATFGDGKLTLMFDKTTLELRQWIVTDAQGLDTSIAIYNTEVDQALDPQLFKIYVTQDLR
jgi:outer membrane lipoprotein-sorting protein